MQGQELVREALIASDVSARHRDVLEKSVTCVTARLLYLGQHSVIVPSAACAQRHSTTCIHAGVDSSFRLPAADRLE